MGLYERVDRAGVDDLVDQIERAIPEVYAYLARRCGQRTLAEDLTSDVVLAAVDHLNAGHVDAVEVGYLIGIARHKLVDQWRRDEREQRKLQAVAGERPVEPTSGVLEPGRTAAVLAELNAMQRAALTLRYVDDLSVPDVARLLGRSVHATETLLVRAKRAFRGRYNSIEEGCR